MASKTFKSGTVIDADWLNDVNTKTYYETFNGVSRAFVRLFNPYLA